MKTLTPHRLSVLLGALALGAASETARADDYHVANAQDLQNALTVSATNGADNTIWLTSGYYPGNFNYNSTLAHNLTVLPEPGVTNTQVVIDGTGTGRDMNLTDTVGNNITVQGITFLRNCGNLSIGALRIAAGPAASVLVQNCLFLSPSNSSGMGLEVASGLNVTVTNCPATGANTGGSGTGMAISGVSGIVSVQSCAFSTNSGYNASGLVVGPGASLVVVNNDTFTGNAGVGAVCGGAAVTFSGNVFTGNLGGGAETAYSGWSPTTVTILDNSFIGNSGGGGADVGAAGAGGSLTLSGNTFTSNSGNGANLGANSGGMTPAATMTVISNTFSGNSGVGVGAGGNRGDTLTFSGNTFTANSSRGLYCQGSLANYLGGVTLSGNTFTHNLGGGAYCDGSQTITLTGNTFTGNSTGSSGGGVFCGDSDTVTLSANTFSLNSAATGGGIYCSSRTNSLLDNLVVKNSETGVSSQAGGIWVDASATLNMINNTVFGNTAAGSGGGAAFQVDGTVELLNVFNNIIWGNTASGSGGDVWLGGTGKQKLFLFNDVELASMSGVWDLTQSNIDLAPQFFDPVNGDYHTQSTSPCIGAGTLSAPSLPATDLDGNPRINSAGLVDMGCYEFNTIATHPADTNAAFIITAAEFNAYAFAWKNGLPWTIAPSPVPANYLTRAGYLMTNGGTYHNDGSTRPTNWKPGN